MIKSLLRKLLGFRKDDGGAALLYVTITIPVLFAVTSLAIDVGYVFYLRTKLQTAADMGALAGASKLYTDTDQAVKDLATTYVNYNLPAGWTTGPNPVATSLPEIKCLTAITNMGLTCAPKPPLSGGNALKVTVTATTPLFFATALGFKSITLSANSMVSGGGSSPPPLNVAIILDATGSMNSSLGTSCGSLSNPPKIQCASLAAKTLLTKLWASVDQVALYTYPSYDANSLKTFTCATGNNGVKTSVSYKSAVTTPNYRMIDFTDSFMADKGNPPTGGLDPTSPMIKILGKTASTPTATDSTTCNGLNLSNLGGQGTSIADAIAQAQKDLLAANVALVAAGLPKRQNVMIVLSDGDANANVDTGTDNPFLVGSDAPPSSDPGWSIDVPRQMDQCQAAVTAADAATAAGTWVYAIAFSAPYAANGSCFSDRPVTSVNSTANVVLGSRTCSSSNKCKAVASVANTVASTVFAKTSKTQIAVTGWGGTVATTCTKADGSTSGTCTTTLSNPTKVQTDTYDLSKYDTTACATMKGIASDSSKFYSTDGNTKCNAAANITDLVTIFNNVAASIMKKRRIPSSTS